MASEDTRTAINAAVVAAASPTPVFDLSDYVTLDDALAEIDSEAVLIQYTTSGERAQSVGGPGSTGWEEDGTVTLHLVVPTGFASAPAIQKGDSIRLALRGQRVSPSVTIESADPFIDFGSGASGLYGGSFKGYASNCYYVNRTCG
jgi:hypothetical protein